ncbi:MAG: hypothetical protein CL949_13705 [Erythrobacter sp.]|nr:hypothetical protein [Erythrobacter sp.]
MDLEMRIFIDDERLPLPEEAGQWLVVRTAHAAITALREHAAEITHISFDNDLGGPAEGRDIMHHVVGTAMRAPLPLPNLQEIRIHSANIVAAKAMFELAHGAKAAGVIPAHVWIVSRSALHERYPIDEDLA